MKPPAPGAVPRPMQVNYVVTDLSATLAFYRLLGWEIQHEPPVPHAEAQFEGVSVEFDEVPAALTWNSGFAGAVPGSTVLTLAVATRGDVDELWIRMTSAGYADRQPPFDAFWGSRFAIVDDPDGHQVAFMSPRDESLRSWPPTPPPTSRS